MKRITLLIGGILISTTLFAQKPVEKTPLSLEGQIGLSAIGGVANLSFSSPSLRLRYFVTDKVALRLTVGIDNKKTARSVNELPDGTGAAGKYEFKRSNTIFAIGTEYHFKGTERLSPYIGLDIKAGAFSNKESSFNADLDINGEPFYLLNFTEKYTAKGSIFGMNIVAGTDFYFAKNFYFGLELGLGFQNTVAKNAVREEQVIGLPVNTTVTQQTKITEFSNNFIGNFRLGWRF